MGRGRRGARPPHAGLLPPRPRRPDPRRRCSPACRPSTPTTSRCGSARSSAARPSTPRTHGGYPHMLSKHLGLALTEEQRARWVALITPAADDAGLPGRSRVPLGLLAYVEWGTRIALANSQPGVDAAARGAGAALGLGRGAALPARLIAVRTLRGRCRSAPSRWSATSPSTSSPPSSCSAPPTSRPTRCASCSRWPTTRRARCGTDLSLGYTETARPPAAARRDRRAVPGARGRRHARLRRRAGGDLRLRPGGAGRRRPRRRGYARLPVAARGRAGRGRAR